MFKYFFAPIFALAIPIFAHAQVVPTNKALEWANGEWALDPEQSTEEQLKEFNCKTSPMTVKINAKDMIYTSKHIGHDAEVASITFAADTFIKIKYKNEERIMDDGKLHIWIMYFVDKDHFTWVRQDWVEGGVIKNATAMRARCSKIEVS